MDAQHYLFFKLDMNFVALSKLVSWCHFSCFITTLTCYDTSLAWYIIFNTWGHHFGFLFDCIKISKSAPSSLACSLILCCVISKPSYYCFGFPMLCLWQFHPKFLLQLLSFQKWRTQQSHIIFYWYGYDSSFLCIAVGFLLHGCLRWLSQIDF